MANEIQVYKNEQLGEVRCFGTEDGKVYFLASDVAKGLGYSTTAAMTRSLDDDEKGVQIVHTLGGDQQMTVISESGFYHAALKSRVKKSKMFRRWVTEEVIPQIFRTGGYIPVKEDDDEKTILCKALMIYKRTIEEKVALIEAQKPLVNFANAVTSSEGSILIRDLAKLITQNGVKIGQSRLFYWMRLKGYLFQHETRPKQEWVEAGLFDTTIRLVQTHHGTMERCTTKVTGKGQRYFIEGFLSGKFCAENGEFK